MNLMIDTLGYAEALEQSGFTSEQAKGAAKALNNTVGEELATKADLAQLGSELRAEMAETRTELRTEIAEVRTELRAEMAELRTELHTEIVETRTELRAEITELRAEVKGELKLIHWMLGIVVIAVVIPLIRDFLL